jgi:hypothetical protein
MVPLLNTCIQKLQEQSLKQLFLDAVTESVDSFQKLGRSSPNGNSWNYSLIILGFKEWAVYRDVCRDI